MLDCIVSLLPEQAEDFNPAAYGIRIAVIGRPNVGKSKLVNSMLQRERVIVSEMAGTTRDTIDTTFRYIPDGGAEERPHLHDHRHGGVARAARSSAGSRRSVRFPPRPVCAGAMWRLCSLTRTRG
jgi:hypothetical protein